MAALFAALPSAQHDMDAATLKEFESLTPEKKALVHAHLGNTDVAAMLLDHALKLRPANPEALLNLGVMREQQGRPDDAMRSYSEAYALEPSAAQAPHNLCNLLLHHYNAVSGEAAQAEHLSVCRRAVANDPSRVDSHELLGVLYTNRMLYGEAVATFRRAAALEPHGGAGNNLIVALQRGGYISEARDAAERALRLRPAQWGSYLTLASVLETTTPNCARASELQLAGLRQYLEQKTADDAGLERACVWRLSHDWLGRGDWAGGRPARRLWGSVRPLHAASRETYGQARAFVAPPFAASARALPRLRFRDKAVYVLRLRNVHMQGANGVLYSHRATSGGAECTVHLGGERGVARASLSGEAHSWDGAAAVHREVEGPVASTVQFNLGNYGHWVTEGLSRVVLLVEHLRARNASGEETRRVPILLDGGADTVRRSMEALRERLGLEERDVLWYTPPPKGSSWLLRELYVVDWAVPPAEAPPPAEEEGCTGDGGGGGDGCALDAALRAHNAGDPWNHLMAPRFGLLAVRRALLPPAARDPREWSVLYVSREDAGVRKVRREAEALVPAMRDAAGVDAAGRSRLAVFTGRGKTLREQMDAFANAEVVIGPYGAGMLNLMWAPEGCAVVIFHLDPPIDAVYAHTAVAIGHELWTVPTASSYYYGFYELDEAAVADVAATLKHVLTVRGLREAEAEPPGSEEPPSFTEAALYPDLGEEYERGW